jgi:hypothetical protein
MLHNPDVQHMWSIAMFQHPDTTFESVLVIPNIDVNTLGYANFAKDKEAKVFVEKLKDVTMTMTPFKNDIATGKMVVRFNDSKNALLIISDMVQKATEMQNRRDLSMR